MPLRRLSFSDMDREASESSSESGNDMRYDREDDQWLDAEPDGEVLDIVSLFDDQKFSDAKSMLNYCKEKFGFDFIDVQRRLNLDFYGRIKLVNYVRMEVVKGNLNPDVSTTDIFLDEKYLQPVIEDDALLFSLDDLESFESEQTSIPEMSQTVAPGGASNGEPSSKIKELEEQLAKVNSQYAEYREYVQQILDKRWQDNESASIDPKQAQQEKAKEGETSYFESYSYNEIHETMLKDTVRTDAYRDFIYDNKHLFKDKVVLDVGCGTGILSLFCARAGASKVIAVDNSTILSKARANVHANGLSAIIECVAGKIEEVTLPVAQVDIIVSEWMGYCLLFEAMLPSVLWARDRYLAPAGLMVPSHCVLHVAPLADAALVADNVEFWHDVYGFNMQAMMEKIYDDVLVRTASPETMAGPSDPFLVLPLHTVQVADLTFRRPFAVTVSETVENLDGWALWFDTFFLPSRSSTLSLEARAELWAASNRPGNAFTTGPVGKETHWRSGIMIIDRSKKPPRVVPRGTKITGTIGYAEAGANKRSLEIEITWHVDGSNEHGQQIWYVH